MKGIAVAAAFMERVHKQRPDAPGLVAGSESGNLSVCLNNPGPAQILERGDVVRLGDAIGVGESVLAHGQAHTMHARNVALSGLPQCHQWALTPELSRAAKRLRLE